MRVTGIEDAQLIEQAAEEVGVRLYNVRQAGKGYAFTIKTGEPYEQERAPNGRLRWAARYRRKAQYPRRRNARNGETFYATVPGAVCWHGHRDFMRALFRRAPDARIQTALADYKGSEDFERKYLATYGSPAYRMGALLQVQAYGAACTCKEGGPGQAEYAVHRVRSMLSKVAAPAV